MSDRPRSDVSASSGLLACLACAVALALALRHFGPQAKACLLWLAGAACRQAGLVSARYAEAAQRIEALDPAALSLGFCIELANRACFWHVLLLACPLALAALAWSWRISPADIFRRTLGMQDLLRASAPFNACVAPALNWPGGILAEPLDSGPWMAGRQPIQCAAALGLLKGPDGRAIPASELLEEGRLANPASPWLRPGSQASFDREKAAAWLASQLGAPWEGWDALPPHLRKLSLAWMLFATDRKREAQALLDELSLSFRAPQAPQKARFVRRFPFVERSRPGHPYLLSCRLPGELASLAKRLCAEGPCAEALGPHRTWANLALLSLYECARRKGVLPTSEFIWLRPVDRRLYYLCNNLGRRSVWPEIAGAWAHYQTETLLGSSDPAFAGLADPHVEEACDALEAALFDEGWIAPERLSPKLAQRLQAG